MIRASQLIKLGKTYSLGIDVGPDTPASAPREYYVTVVQLNDGTGTPRGSKGFTANADFITLWLGYRTQIDGLGHIGID